MPKKITFILSSPGGGGSERVAVNIANRLVAKGWNIDLVCMNFKRKEYLGEISKKVNLVNLSISRFALSFFGIRSYIKKNKVTHILSFHYLFSVQLVLIRLLLKNKFKIISRNNTFLSLEEKYYFKNKIFKYFLFVIVKFLYPKVDYLIAQCKEMKKDLIQNYNFKRKKIKVIYNPVNYKIENSYKKKKKKKDNFILMVGRLNKYKGYDVAIKVFTKIKKKFPMLKLKISGKGEEKKFLEDLANKYGVKESVEFLGFKKDLSTLYKKAKLTLLTSSYEGFPNVLIESITLGTPVVSFNCPVGPSKIIKNGVNGYLVKLHDENMLEEKIIETLSIKWNKNIVNQSAYIYKNKNIITEYEKMLDKFI